MGGKCGINGIVDISRVLYVRRTMICRMVRMKARFRVMIMGEDEVIFLF